MSEQTLSLRVLTPHTSKKEKKWETKRESADFTNNKALTLLLKPGTPSNIMSLRSFQKDTEM